MIDRLEERTRPKPGVATPASLQEQVAALQEVVREIGGQESGAVDLGPVTARLDALEADVAALQPPDLTPYALATHTHALPAHQHPQSDVSGLESALTGKAPTAHGHAQSDVTGLVAALNAKAAAVHSHTWSEISNPPATFPAAPHTHPASEITGLPSGGGTLYGSTLVFHPPYLAASAAATNLAANTVNAVGDPNYRQFHDLRGMTKARLLGRIGGTLVAATRLRIQYHLGGNPAVVTGDAGWVTLLESAGSHTVNVLFYGAETAIPAAAQVNHVLLRVVLFGGDGVADPTLTACLLNVYP